MVRKEMESGDSGQVASSGEADISKLNSLRSRVPAIEGLVLFCGILRLPLSHRRPAKYRLLLKTPIQTNPSKIAGVNQMDGTSSYEVSPDQVICLAAARIPGQYETRSTRLATCTEW